MSYVYLASPYSDLMPSVCEARFYEVCKCAAHFINKGGHIFSPIAHSHPIAMAGELPGNFEYWKEYDRIMIEHSRALWVLLISGWRKSKGVEAEILIARSLGKEVSFVIPNLEKETYTVEKNYSYLRGNQNENDKYIPKKFR